MEFTTNSTVLRNIIPELVRIIPSRPAMRICSMLHFDVREQTFSATATDGETRLTLTGEIFGTYDHSGFCVEARLLSDIVKNIPPGIPVKFTVTSADITIDYTSGKYTLPVTDANLFPVMLEIRDTQYHAIPSAILRLAMAHTAYAAASDTIRPQLCGMLMSLTENRLTFCATDTCRLALLETDSPELQGEFSVIIPAKATASLAMLARNEQTVSMRCDNRHIEFSCSAGTLTASIPTGNFPNFRRVIPDRQENHLRCERAALTSALDRVLVCSPENSVCTLSLNVLAPIVSTSDAEYNRSASADLTAEYDGQDISIGLNATLLKEIIKHQPAEKITIAIADASRPITIIPDADINMRTILMPARIS